MIHIRFTLSEEATNRLMEQAVEECRPMPRQAEVLVLRSLGLMPPFKGNDTRSTEVKSACDALAESFRRIDQRLYDIIRNIGWVGPYPDFSEAAAHIERIGELLKE